MAGDLLAANQDHGDFTFQHQLCHDFESLIWVIVYAMMIHQRNTFATGDQGMYGRYKSILDDCWAAHSYSNLLRSQVYMIGIGCSLNYRKIASSWFPDSREVAFFCDAMRLLRNQTQDGDPITYEGICTLFKKHTQLAKESRDPNVAPN